MDGSLKTFIANALAPMALLDTDLRYVACSREWQRLFELGKETLVGRLHGEVFPELPGRWVEALHRGLSGLATSCERDCYRLPNGGAVWTRWQVVPVRLDAGTVVGIAIYSEDITQRVLAQEELHRGHERLEEITSVLGIGLFEHDYETGKSTMSDGWLELLGMTRDTAPLNHEEYIKSLRPVDVASYLADRQRALDPSGDGRFFCEARPIVNGRERAMQVQSRVLFAGEGSERHPRRVIGVLVDRTEAQRMQEALSRAQRLETVGRVAGMVAHDFNNTLTVILANLELAQLRNNDPALRQLLRQASDAADMGAGFNKRLLALAGGHRGAAAPMVLDNHVTQVWEVFRRVLRDEITLHFEPGADGAVVAIDPAELDGAILNLVVNARDAQPEGGSIVLRSKRVTLSDSEAASFRGGRPGEFLRLSVTDRGRGMPEEVAARAEEPFFTTKGSGRGTGLGLTSVALTAERAGGFIHIITAPGAGTEVAIYLPISTQAPPASALGSDRSIPFGNGELVLVVEDDPLVRETVLQRLEALGYAVLEAGNADAALAVIDQGEPVDLVFSDVVMPGAMSGFDLMRKIRADHPGMAVLMTSGHVSSAFRSHDAPDPPVPLLAKPYMLRDLAEAVAKALRRPVASA